MAIIVDGPDDLYFPEPAERRTVRASSSPSTRSSWFQRNSDSRPFPPTPYPDVSPVDDLRRRTVNLYGLSDEARESLYNTGTRIGPVGDGYAGYWDQYGEYPINVSSDVGFQEGVLQHEHAHKWWDQDLNPLQRRRYQAGYRSNPTAQRAWEDYNFGEVPEYVPSGNPLAYDSRIFESYAKASETPFSMTPEYRTRHYPGLFDEQELGQREADRSRYFPTVQLEIIGEKPTFNPPRGHEGFRYGLEENSPWLFEGESDRASYIPPNVTYPVWGNPR